MYVTAVGFRRKRAKCVELQVAGTADGVYIDVITNLHLFFQTLASDLLRLWTASETTARQVMLRLKQFAVPRCGSTTQLYVPHSR